MAQLTLQEFENIIGNAYFKQDLTPENHAELDKMYKELVKLTGNPVADRIILERPHPEYQYRAMEYLLKHAKPIYELIQAKEEIKENDKGGRS